MDLKNNTHSVITLILLVLLICSTGISNAATVYVDTDGSGDYNCDGTGLSDLCTSASTPNGTQASCNFDVPWTSGSHTIDGRLYDGNDTSIEYTRRWFNSRYVKPILCNRRWCIGRNTDMGTWLDVRSIDNCVMVCDLNIWNNIK